LKKAKKMSNLGQREYQVLIDQFIDASVAKYGSHSYAAGWLGATLAASMAHPSKDSPDTVTRFLLRAIDGLKSP
jgi:hypothetical protein